MSNQLTQVETDKPATIVKPTDKNFEVFGKYRSGKSINELAEEYGLTDKAIYHHIDRVKSFLGDSWQKFTLTDMKVEFDEVKQSFTNLVRTNDSKTVNNYLNKMVYPDRSVSKPRSINFNMIAKKIQVGTFKQQGQAIEAEAEIIDDK